MRLNVTLKLELDTQNDRLILRQLISMGVLSLESYDVAQVIDHNPEGTVYNFHTFVEDEYRVYKASIPAVRAAVSKYNSRHPESPTKLVTKTKGQPKGSIVVSCIKRR